MKEEEINDLSNAIDSHLDAFDWDEDFERMIRKYEGI